MVTLACKFAALAFAAIVVSSSSTGRGVNDDVMITRMKVEPTNPGKPNCCTLLAQTLGVFQSTGPNVAEITRCEFKPNIAWLRAPPPGMFCYWIPSGFCTRILGGFSYYTPSQCINYSESLDETTGRCSMSFRNLEDNEDVVLEFPGWFFTSPGSVPERFAAIPRLRELLRPESYKWPQYNEGWHRLSCLGNVPDVREIPPTELGNLGVGEKPLIAVVKDPTSRKETMRKDSSLLPRTSRTVFPTDTAGNVIPAVRIPNA